MNELITSRRNPRILAVAQLRETRHRRESQRILIDGHRELARATDAGVTVEQIFVCRDILGEKSLPATNVRIKPPEIVEVTAQVFERISYGERNDGFVAVAQRPKISLADLCLPPAPLIAIIEGVEKPGNLGAILRSADAAGVSAVLAIDEATDIYGPNVIRASLGAVFCVPIVETTAAEVKDWLQNKKMTLISATPEATTIYTDLNYTGPTALLFGSEAKGLTSGWTGSNVLAARVPMHGRVDSLNVSITAALFFYEALRQRVLLKK